MSAGVNAPTVLLLTDEAHPELHPDDRPLVEAFIGAGWRVRAAVWSGSIPGGDLALIRSTWDYTSRLAEFLAVVESVAARMPLWNPAGTVRWNSDKSYLDELGRAGIPVPATAVIRQGSDRELDSVLHQLGTDEVVVKPLIGAGGYRTHRMRAGMDRAWRDAVGHEDLLVQEFIPEVVSDGEWSLLHFGGEYSHAVLKRASAGEFRVQPQHGGEWESREPAREIRAAAARVLAAVQHPWLYARVDGVMTRRGFVLMELELIEPQLFFEASPDAARRLVQRCIALRA
ncbi:MAG TPA: hypothetical protein PLL69_12945, partial [Gemmatimonadales bacterium]|nr:hypothetical protein [Gemmatimonadales bacterium]